MSALCPLHDAGSGSDDPDLKRSGLGKGGTLSLGCGYWERTSKTGDPSFHHWAGQDRPETPLEKVDQDLRSPKVPLSPQRGGWVNW